METHPDLDVQNTRRREEFLAYLQGRADAMVKNKLSQITAGKDGEEVLEEWQTNEVHVRHLPDDEQGILRISIGGGQTPVPLNYCVFRGSHGQVVDLLRKALLALEKGPE